MTDFFSLPQPDVSPGKVVRALRKNFGFTLSDMESLIGVAESNLSAIENDARAIGMELAIKFAAVFGIDPGLILFPEGMGILDAPNLRKIHAKAVKLQKRKCG
jgi:transcriptional regulator with XRE-family HTH domain